MEIKVSVENVDLTSVVGQHRARDEDGDYVLEPQTLGQAVAAQIADDLMRTDNYKGLKGTVLDLREQEIREQLRPIVAAAIEGPVQKTNSYGEPYGETTTLRALIIAEVEKLLKEPADRYNRDKGTWLSDLVREQVDKALRAELADVLKEEKAKVVAAVRAKAADLIATAVKEGVGR